MIPSTTPAPGSSFAPPAEEGRCSAGRPRIRLLLVGAALTMTSVLGVSNAVPSQALTFNPGVMTSSVYLSQSETKAVAGSAATRVATKVSVLCRLLGPSVPGLGCTVAVTASSRAFKSAVTRAAATDGCLRIRLMGTPEEWLRAHSFPVPVGWYADRNAVFCKP